MTSPRYPVPDINSLPDDIKAKVVAIQEKTGFVPNVFLAFARRPAEWRAFFAYHDALMTPEAVGRTSGLTKGEREMIVTTTSAANQCLYCVVAHGAILRIYEKKPRAQPNSARMGVGNGTDFCCGKFTHTVVAPPLAYTVSGSSSRAKVHQLSKLLRPGSLTYIVATTVPGYSSCL